MMKSILRFTLVSIILLFLWQGIVYCWQIPDYLLPSPIQVFNSLHTQWHLILEETWPTLIETLLGFFLGTLAGCLAGLCIAFFPSLALWLLPILIISQAIPTFAIAPLIVVWLGYGLSSKIVTAIIMIFFPVASAFYDGLKRTETEWLALAKTLNASKWRIFWHIRMPSALPRLASGIRIAAATAPIGAIVGEWVGASTGLGYLMLNANARLQIDLMFAALIVIILIALILYFCIDLLLEKLIWWETV